MLSLIVWSLTLEVTVKYLTFVMRPDNEGKGQCMGGILLVLVPYVVPITCVILLRLFSIVEIGVQVDL